MKEWFDDTQRLGVTVSWRFTENTKRFWHNFMMLIKWSSHEDDPQLEKQRAFVLAYFGLRHAVSLFNKFATKEEQISQLA